jgi:tRNA (guanine10-N2)-methyltransferase
MCPHLCTHPTLGRAACHATVPCIDLHPNPAPPSPVLLLFADPYGLGECLQDLLEFAARMLVIGGRLVYFMPATPDTYRQEDIPTHPMLRLLYNS